MSEAKTGAAAPSLETVRQRIDALDTELLRLVDERAALARVVATAKQAAGEGDRFALRPGREAAILRRLIAQERTAASPALIVRIWRELIGDSLSVQGPFHLTVWGGRDPGHTAELARHRFGAAPPMRQAAKPEEAIHDARAPGGVAICALTPDSAWWGRLLAEPQLRVFAALPCLNAWGHMSALAVAAVEVEPTGHDNTFWVTDSPLPNAAILDALSQGGAAGELVAEAGGLKLYALAGFYQADDARLDRFPGRLTGVIGAAPAPLDV